MNELVLIRGLPGSGKSTLAKELAEKGYWHFEADMFFVNGAGEYVYNREILKDAHEWCKRSAEMVIGMRHNAVVSNTFSRKWEMQPYIDAAKMIGVPVRIIEAKGQFENIHGVPAEAIEAMRARWEEV